MSHGIRDKKTLQTISRNILMPDTTRTSGHGIYTWITHQHYYLEARHTADHSKSEHSRAQW